MKNNGKISIIVPIYNARAYLLSCVESILTQEYGDLEVILVNDGSTDGSEVLCSELAEKDPRILFLTQPNRGVSGARNLGLSHATGEYVMFVDSDDTIEPSFCAGMISAADATNADLVIGGYTEDDGVKRIRHGKEEEIRISADELRQDFDSYYKKNILGCPFSKLYKRERIADKRFEEGFPMGEDFLFNLSVYEECKDIVFIPVFGYIYNVQNQNSATKKYKKEYFYCYKKCFAEGKKFRYGHVQFSNDALSEMFCINVIYALQAVCYSEDRREIKTEKVRAMIKDPMFSEVCYGKYKLPLRLSVIKYFCQRGWYLPTMAFFSLKKFVAGKRTARKAKDTKAVRT